MGMSGIATAGSISPALLSKNRALASIPKKVYVTRYLVSDSRSIIQLGIVGTGTSASDLLMNPFTTVGRVTLRPVCIADSISSTTVLTKKTSKADAKSDQMFPQILMSTSNLSMLVLTSTLLIYGTWRPSGRTF